MSKLKVEVIEPDGFKEGYIERSFGDVFTSENGAEYVKLGWCKDVATGKAGTRIAGTQEIKINNVVVDLK